MRISIQLNSIKCIVIVVLCLSAGGAIGQSTISTIPQQVNQSAQTKAVTKTNTVTNSAMNSLDSASNKAFKGLTGMFKKKNKGKKGKTDSTGVHSADTTVVPPKTSFHSDNRPPSICSMSLQQQPYPDAAFHYSILKRRTFPIVSVRV